MRFPELLADLPDNVCRLLRIDTTSQVVMINHERVSHIFERRSFQDAATIIGVLARGAFDPLYCGREVAEARFFFIVESLPADLTHCVRLVLKHGAASTSASKHDEIWVTTAYVVNNSTLFRMLRSNRFVMYQTTRGR